MAEPLPAQCAQASTCRCSNSSHNKGRIDAIRPLRALTTLLSAIEQLQGGCDCFDAAETHRLKCNLNMGNAFAGERAQRFGKYLGWASKCSCIGASSLFCWVHADRDCLLQRGRVVSDFLTRLIDQAAQWRNFFDPASIGGSSHSIDLHTEPQGVSGSMIQMNLDPRAG